MFFLRVLLAVAVAFVQKTDNAVAGAATNYATVWGGNPATGNAVLICVFWKGAVTISSVTDSQSNTYADCGAGRLARPTDGFLQLLGAKNITGGTTPTVTVNFSGAANSIDVFLLEYSGQDTGTLFDSVTSTATATSGTTVTTGSFTPTISAGAVVAFAASDDTNATAGTNYTIRSNVAASGEGVEDRIFSSSLGSITASMTLSAAVTKAGIIACTLRAAQGYVPRDLAHTPQHQTMVAQ